MGLGFDLKFGFRNWWFDLKNRFQKFKIDKIKSKNAISQKSKNTVFVKIQISKIPNLAKNPKTKFCQKSKTD